MKRLNASRSEPFIAAVVPSRSRWLLVAGVILLVVVALAALVLALLARHPAIDPVARPARASFAPERIERGRRLAALGNCSSCHTTRDGAPYAGGVPLVSALGTIHGTNITPDDETGIGTWSEPAFVRAMRDGVARDGTQLYPAFPYDHFTIATDDDLGALYAFVMTRTPVHAVPPANALRFPFGWRPLVAGWNVLHLRKGPRDGSDHAIDRGAYLVDGLGHCGACHTPRDLTQAEIAGRRFAGARIEGWYAPPLDATSPSPQPWDRAHLVDYLRHGIADGHAIAGGPMQGVVAQLADADPADVEAIADAIVASMGPPTADRERRARESSARAAVPLATTPLPGDADTALRDGAAVYAEACASCHDRGRQVSSEGALRMPLAVALYDDDPRSLLRIVRDGIVPGDAERRRWMPAFGDTLDDARLAALAHYLRRVAADRPDWPDLDRAVQETRR